MLEFFIKFSEGLPQKNKCMVLKLIIRVINVAKGQIIINHVIVEINPDSDCISIPEMMKTNIMLKHFKNMFVAMA